MSRPTSKQVWFHAPDFRTALTLRDELFGSRPLVEPPAQKERRLAAEALERKSVIITPAIVPQADSKHVRRVRRKRSSAQRGLRKRHWCFTSFRETMPPLTDYDVKVIRYLVYQREIAPETKRLHWQGYIEFYDNKRIGQVKSILGECHLEPRNGSRTEARMYCMKDSTHYGHADPVEWGFWREDVTRKRTLNDMLLAGVSIDELCDVSPVDYVRYHRGIEKLDSRRKKKKARTFRTVEVVVYVGPTGSGKTRKAIMENPSHFLMPSGDKLWMDGYEGEEVLIMDDFYGSGVRYGTLLRILDGHELQLPVKGGFIWAQWTKVVITSNSLPATWYLRGLTPALARRINVVHHMSVPEVIVISSGDESD